MCKYGNVASITPLKVSYSDLCILDNNPGAEE